MSQQIDNQIVKMQFDNASFEKNVQESMSTLDKLKAALKFDKVNMTPLQQAFEETEATATKSGFHIRDIWLKVANTIEDQVANKIVDSGKKIFNALTLEGVADGFKEYELKMGSIQTIMAGTGESLATVNKYLDELNTYSDKTIYSFSDMTNSIGKFTNAGVKLEDAVAAIKGIANEAAVSGANSNEASRAMYNFSQALSAGYVKLIDWKSIENANMATKEFKQTLIDVAQGIGTVVKVGDDWQTTTTNMQGKVSDLFNSTKGFNDSLNHQWMTTEVLNNALEIYATDIRDANVNVEKYEEHLREDLHLSQEQIEKYEQLGVKAADAATEVKTFSMLIDTLKEAIGSGWAMTWQYFIGDFEQAKTLWTEVNDVLGGLIGRMSDARNEFLKEGLQTGWEKFTTLPEMAIPESEKFREVLVDLAREQNILTKEQYVGINSTQTFVDSLHELNWLTGDLLTESVDDYTNTLKSMTKEERDAMGVSEDQMAQLEKLCQGLKDGSLNADEFAESMGKLGGRENIIQGLRNIFVSLGNVLKPVGEAFDNVFGIMDPQKLFDLTERFRKFTEELKVSEDAANTIRTAFTLAFGGIKTIIEGVSTAIKGFTKLILPVFNLFDAIFGLIGKVVAALTGSKGALDAADKFTKIGDKISDKYLWAMQKLADFINKVADAIRGIPDAVIFTKIHDGVESAIKAFNQFWDEFTNLPIIQQMVEDFWSTVAKIEETVTPMIDAVKNSLGDLGAEVESKLNWDTVNTVLSTVYNKIKDFISIIKDFATRIKTFFTNLKEGKSVVESFRTSFGDIIEKIQELKQKAKDFFDDLFSKGDELGDKFNLDKIAQSIHDFVANITPEQITMLAIAGTFVLIALNMIRLSEAIKNAIDSFTGIGLALKNVINSYVKKQKSTILQIAEAIVIVAAAILVLSKIPKDELDRAVGALITLTICLGALVGVLTAAGIALHKLGGEKSMVELAAGLAFVAGSFMAVAVTLKLLEYVNLDGVLPKILVMSGIMVGLVGLSVLMGKLDRFSKGSLTMLAISGALLLTATSLAKIGEIPTEKIESSMDAMLKIMLGLAAITFASGKVGAFSAIGLLAVVLTIDKLIPAIERIVNYDYDKMGTGIEKNKEVLIKLGGLVLIMTAIGAIAGNRIKGAGIAMLSISATFAILLGLSKLAGMLKPQELAKGEQFLWSMAGIIALLELCSSRARIGMFGGKNGGEGSKMFTRIAVAMGIMLGIAKLASMMEWKDIVKGEVAVLGLVGLVFAMIEVSKRAKNAEGVVKSVAGMLFALSLILGEVALLSMIPMGNMLPALASILAILGALALLALAVSKNTTIFDRATQMKASTAGALIGAMVAVVALGVVMTQLAKEPIRNVGAAALAVVGIIAAMSLFARAMGKINSGLSVGQIQAFLEAAAIVWVVSEFLKNLITYMKDNTIDPNVMLKAAGAIALVLVAITPALSALSLFRPGGTNYAAMGKAFIFAIGILASVAASIGFLSNLGNPATLIDSAVAISIGLVAVCVPLAVLGAIGKYCQSVNFGAMAKIVGASIVVLAGVAGAIWALSTYGNPETMIQSAQALAITLVAISVPIAVIGVVGELCKNVNPLSVVAIVGGAIVALAAICKLLPELAANLNIEMCNTLNAAMPALLKTIAAIGALSLAISVAGLVAGMGNPAVALVGGLVLVEALIIFFGTLTLLGAALERFDWLGPVLVRGLDFIVVIAEKLGFAAGALIGGFGVGLSSQLDPIADNMTSFSEKMIIFSNNMKQVNDKALDGCKNLAGAMLYLGAAEFVDGLTRWLGFGKVGEMDFSTLGRALAGFCESIKDIPEDAITKASACSVIVKRLAEVASALDTKGGLAGLIFGDKQSMDDFADGVKSLGKAIRSFCEEVVNIPENAVEMSQRAADAAKPLVELTKTLVAEGGIVQAIIGEKNLGSFGESLSGFISGIVSFVGALSVLEAAAPNYPELIQKCADATTPMVDLARGIQNSGGILAEWVGENTLDVFADTLVPFAKGLYTFLLIISQMATDVPNFSELTTSVADATTGLINMANSLENMGGAAGFFAGDNTLDRFGNTLESFGMSISTYAETIANVNAGSLTAINAPVESLIGLAVKASFVAADSFYGFNMAMADLVTAINSVFSIDTSMDITIVTDHVNSLLDSIFNIVNGRQFDDQAKYSLYGIALVNGIIDGINANWPLLKARVEKMIKDIFTILTNGMPRSAFNIYGENIVLGIRDGITYNWPTLQTRIATMITAIKNQLNSSSSPLGLIKSEFTKYGKNIIDGIIQGINDNWDKGSNLKRRIQDLVDDIKDILDDGLAKSEFKVYGKNIVDGVKGGIDENDTRTVNSARAMAAEVNETVRDEFEINSPSKVGYRFGKFYDFGIANGIRDYASTAVASTENMSEEIVNVANTIISAIYAAMDDNIDVQPTIRPVVDTSDVVEKAGIIGKLFDSADLQLAYKASGTIKEITAEKVQAMYGNTSNKEKDQVTTNQINYTQNNYSPKALSRIEIYRDTKNLLSAMKGVVRANG